jgi:predicted GIY-YIG superfamily endonuclease
MSALRTISSVASTNIAKDWLTASPEHRVKALVYDEQHATAMTAIQREKNTKHWSRQWKIALIRSLNPDWRDLWGEIAR